MNKVQRLERQRDNLVATLEATPVNKDASAIIRRLGALNVAIADARLPKRELAVIRKRMKRTKKRIARNPSYVSRPSQITKTSPTARLKRRRKKNLRAPRKGFFPNPAPVLFAIYARKDGKGPKMHFDGKHFSQRKTVKRFSTANEAASKAKALIARYPVLQKYRITVESPPRPR